MFEIGFAELFLLGVIALLVVGPDRLPALARTVGVWVGRAQRLVGQVRADIEREVRADELRKAAKEYSPTGMIGDMRKEVEDFASEVSKPVDLDEEKAGSAKPDPSDPAPAAAGGPRERGGRRECRAGVGTGRAGSGGCAGRRGRARFCREARRGRIRAGGPWGVLGGSGRRCKRCRTGVGRSRWRRNGPNRRRPSHPLRRRTRRSPERRKDGEPEHTVDSRPAAVSGAEDDVDLTNGQVAEETATAAVTEGPETTPGRAR